MCREFRWFRKTKNMTNIIFLKIIFSELSKSLLLIELNKIHTSIFFASATCEDKFSTAYHSVSS